MTYIVVMVDGQVSEVGTYSELLRRRGAFAEFLRLHLESENLEEEILDEEGLVYFIL